VTQFAAGCSICGTDLEAARAALAERRARRPALPSLPRVSDDLLPVGVSLLVALFSPLFGLLLSGFLAYSADNDGLIRRRNLLLAVAALSVVLLFVPFWIWGGLFAGGP
jgi:hypothetical protein